MDLALIPTAGARKRTISGVEERHPIASASEPQRGGTTHDAGAEDGGVGHTAWAGPGTIMAVIVCLSAHRSDPGLRVAQAACPPPLWSRSSSRRITAHACSRMRS